MAPAAPAAATVADPAAGYTAGPVESAADAVFGMIYAQEEDDFARVEANYLTALGRSAEAAGELGGEEAI